MTKKGLLFISLLTSLLILPLAVNAQCKQFAKNTCKFCNPVLLNVRILDVILLILGFYAGDFNLITVLLNLPTLFFELIIAFWLIFKGIDRENYNELSLPSDYN